MNDVESKLAEYYTSKLNVLKKEKDLSCKLRAIIANFMEKEGVSRHVVSIDVSIGTHHVAGSGAPKRCLEIVNLKLLED